jgi:hypothetical protein
MPVCLQASFRIFIISDETRQVNMISRPMLAEALVMPEHDLAFLFELFLERVIGILYFDFVKELIELMMQVVAFNP